MGIPLLTDVCLHRFSCEVTWAVGIHLKLHVHSLSTKSAASLLSGLMSSVSGVNGDRTPVLPVLQLAVVKENETRFAL